MKSQLEAAEYPGDAAVKARIKSYELAFRMRSPSCSVSRMRVEDGNGWDAHSELKKNHSRLCVEVDLPLAGLLRDLKQRGLLKDTLVVMGSEFGRTPGVEVIAPDATTIPSASPP